MQRRRPPLGARLSRAVLPVFTAVAVIYLFLPIAVMIAFSFNNPAGRQNITWQGFTIENYFTLWSRSDVTGPMINSLIVAAVATVFSTDPGHADRAGADALRVPRPRPAEPFDLRAHGDARGDHGRVAALAVGNHRCRSRTDDDHHRPRACSTSATSWSPCARGSPASTGRSRRRRWTLERTRSRRSARSRCR